MKKSFELLPHEISPGVFPAGELQDISYDNAYACRSYNDGDSESLPAKAILNILDTEVFLSVLKHRIRSEIKKSLRFLATGFTLRINGRRKKRHVFLILHTTIVGSQDTSAS